MVVRALLIVAALAAHAVAKDTWSVVPPPGTTEVTETMRPEIEAKLRTAVPPSTEIDVGFWQGEGVHLLVALLRLPIGSDSTTLAGIERGYFGGLRKANAETSFVSRNGRKTRDALQTGTLRGQPARLRLISGIGTDGRARLLQAMCAGDVAACTASIDSLALDERGFADLSAVTRDEGDSAYQLGQILGYVTMLGLVSWGISTAVRKRRRDVRPLKPS